MHDKRVTIAAFFNPASAFTAKSHLEAKGIKVFLDNESAANLTDMLDGVKLQVYEEDVERAMAARDLKREYIVPFEEAPLNPREKKAEQAFRGAVVGIALWPMQLYALWLLFGVLISTEVLRPEKLHRAWFAALISTLMLMVVFFMVSIVLF